MKYNFHKFQTVRSFGDSIFNGKMAISEADQKNFQKIFCNLIVKLDQD